MNPAFIILVLIGAGLLWLLLSWLFPFIGTISKRLWNDAKYNMNKDEKEKEKNDD